MFRKEIFNSVNNIIKASAWLFVSQKLDLENHNLFLDFLTGRNKNSLSAPKGTTILVLLLQGSVLS